MNTISFDIGGTAIKYAVFNSNGEIETKNKRETPNVKNDFLKEIKIIISGYENEYNITKLSFSFPGFINSQNGYAETAGSIEYFTRTNIIEEIEKTVGSKYQYFIENDANCAAMAERNSGNAQDTSSFLLLTIGTGLGGSFYINNELVKGFQFKAGEFGRMRVQTSTSLDSKLNNLISVRDLIKSYKSMKGIPVYTHVSGKKLLNDYDKDKEVENLILNWIDNICIAIFNVTTVLNPEKILIGGGVSAHPLIIKLVRERMSILDDWHEFEVPIETCKYQNDAGILGAYYNTIK